MDLKLFMEVDFTLYWTVPKKEKANEVAWIHRRRQGGKGSEMSPIFVDVIYGWYLLKQACASLLQLVLGCNSHLQ